MKKEITKNNIELLNFTLFNRIVKNKIKNKHLYINEFIIILYKN